MRSILARFGFWLLVWLPAAPALAADAPASPPISAYVGRWALQLDGRNLFILELRAGSTGDALTGTLSGPTDFQINAITAEVSAVATSVMVEPITEARFDNGSLRFVVQNPKDPKDTDTYRFKVFDKDRGGLTIAGVQHRTLSMRGVGPDAVVATDWDPDRVYEPDDRHLTNPEMSRLFDDDQAARKVATIDWPVVVKADAARRARTLDLLNQGKLHSGADFLHAAFIFQHGDKPGDYLLAHTLALVAVKRGRPDASWIAAATLDRYLQAIGQPQIYGTQFTIKHGAAPTREPLDGKLIPDALRTILGVPPLAQQAPPPSVAAPEGH